MITEGTVVSDRYRLQETIASGTLCDVWRGTDEVLGRPLPSRSSDPNCTRQVSRRGSRPTPASSPRSGTAGPPIRTWSTPRRPSCSPGERPTPLSDIYSLGAVPTGACLVTHRSRMPTRWRSRCARFVTRRHRCRTTSRRRPRGGRTSDGQAAGGSVARRDGVGPGGPRRRWPDRLIVHSGDHVRRMVSPSTVMPTGGSGRGAGPPATDPSARLNRLPWHGQLMVPPETSVTMHP